MKYIVGHKSLLQQSRGILITKVLFYVLSIIALLGVCDITQVAIASLLKM